MDCDLNTLTDNYLRHSATRSDDDFWAWQRVDEIVRGGDLDRAWEITLLLLRKAPDDVLGYIAAGPLEDFIDGYGERGLDRAEQACDEDSRLQYALSGIWLLPDSSVLQRWQGLMTKYGFRNGNRKPLVERECFALRIVSDYSLALGLRSDTFPPAFQNL